MNNTNQINTLVDSRVTVWSYGSDGGIIYMEGRDAPIAGWGPGAPMTPLKIVETQAKQQEHLGRLARATTRQGENLKDLTRVVELDQAYLRWLVGNERMKRIGVLSVKLPAALAGFCQSSESW